MKEVVFRTNKGEKSGMLVKENPQTVWVLLGNKYIKRHKVKHNIRK